MEFRLVIISISVLFYLALTGESHTPASIQLDEKYWRAIWPNTPIPSTLRDFLKPGHEGVEIDNLPMTIEDTQYPKTFFYKHDIYPGKTMNVPFSMSPLGQDYGLWVYMHEIKDLDKEGYTLDEICVKQAPARGERRHCAKSLGTLIGFAISKLGKNIQPLSSSFISKQEQYTIQGVQNLGDKAVMCHRLNFKRAVFYCHQIHETTAFMIPLVAGDGTKTHALAVCHHDNSIMNHDMLAQFLNSDPNTKPVCHFLGNKAVLWVPNLAMDSAYNTNFAL